MIEGGNPVISVLKHHSSCIREVACHKLTLFKLDSTYRRVLLPLAADLEKLKDFPLGIPELVLYGGCINEKFPCHASSLVARILFFSHSIKDAPFPERLRGATGQYLATGEIPTQASEYPEGLHYIDLRLRGVFTKIDSIHKITNGQNGSDILEGYSKQDIDAIQNTLSHGIEPLHSKVALIVKGSASRRYSFHTTPFSLRPFKSF